MKLYCLSLLHLSSCLTAAAFRVAHSGLSNRYRALYASEADSKDPPKINEPQNDDGLYFGQIANCLKMQVVDLDEGMYGLDSTNQNYGIEIVKTKVKREPSLGLNLVEMAGSSDGRGLVLVEGCVEGGNAEACGKIRPGDTLSWVGIEPNDMTRVEAVNFDTTIDGLSNYVDEPEITLVLKRLVKRRPVKVVIRPPVGSKADDTEIEILAGSNLRREFLRLDQQVYDYRTNRYDQPYAQGNCGGEGTCGTCLVKIISGAENLTKPDQVETLLIKERPASWRLSCRVVVGADNKEGEVVVQLSPQAAYYNRLEDSE